MVVNFRIREINRGACKLTRTSTLIIIKKMHRVAQVLNKESLADKNLITSQNR